MKVESIKEAQKCIWKGFVWADTEEGHEYWNAVVTKLRRIEEAETEKLEAKARYDVKEMLLSIANDNGFTAEIKLEKVN